MSVEDWRTQSDVEGMVQAHLDRQQPNDYRLHVERDSAQQDDGLWWVAVLPDGDDVSILDYTDRLARSTEQIQDEKALNIMLVPMIVRD